MSRVVGWCDGRASRCRLTGENGIKGGPVSPPVTSSRVKREVRGASPVVGGMRGQDLTVPPSLAHPALGVSGSEGLIAGAADEGRVSGRVVGGGHGSRGESEGQSIVGSIIYFVHTLTSLDARAYSDICRPSSVTSKERSLIPVCVCVCVWLTLFCAQSSCRSKASPILLLSLSFLSPFFFLLCNRILACPSPELVLLCLRVWMSVCVRE